MSEPRKRRRGWNPEGDVSWMEEFDDDPDIDELIEAAKELVNSNLDVNVDFHGTQGLVRLRKALEPSNE